MANLSSCTGMAKPLQIALAGTPFSRTSFSPRSSDTARMSWNALFIDGIPPWWSPRSLRPFMSLKKPIWASFLPPGGLPAVDEGLGLVVGVVLDGDRGALGDLLEHGREHGLADRRLVGGPAGGR